MPDPFDATQAAAPGALAQADPFDATQAPPPEGNVAISDYAKSAVTGALSGTGSIFQGAGELVSRGINDVAGTSLRAVNPFQSVIDKLTESETPAAKRAVAEMNISGEVLKPETWDFGKNPSFKGLALQGLNAIGQFAPNLAMGIMTAGASIPAQVAIGATVGGLQALGGGAEEERHKFMAMSPDELNSSSTLYRTLIAKGVAPDVAKNAVAESAALGGGLGNAIPSAGEGAFENFLIGALTKGRWKIPSLGFGLAGKVATGVVGGGAMGGTEEAVEQAGQNIGSNLAVGGNRPVGADTLQQFVMGMIAEGAAGGGGAVAQHAFNPGERAAPTVPPQQEGGASPFTFETPEESSTRLAAREDPLPRIATATDVDEAIQAAQDAVEYEHPDTAALKAENFTSDLGVAAPPVGNEIEYQGGDATAPSAAVEQAQQAELARAAAEAERVPFEPTQVPATPLELAPQEPAPAAQPGLDITPFLRDQALSKAAAVERQGPSAPVAAAPAYEDYSANGAVRTFKTERGAALFAKSNRLAGWTPRQTEGGWALSRPQTAFAAAKAPLTLTEEKSNARPVESVPAPAAPAAGVTAPAAPAGGVPAAHVQGPPVSAQPGANGAPSFQDFERRGQVKVFSSAKGAKLFQSQRTNGVSTEFAPREVAKGQWRLSRPQPKPLDVERIRSIEPEIGWAEEGGRMIRAADTGGEKAEVTGRTTWIPKSEFWPGRPKGISAGEARAALRKLGTGAALSAKQNRFVEYAQKWLDKQDQAPQPPEREERRGDTEQRKRVTEMAPEEMRKALLTDDLTGLGNRRAWDEAPKKAFVASIDADGLKFINDSMGHAQGDELLRAIGQAMRDEGLDAYHVSGDEFLAQFDAEDHGYEAMQRVRERLDRSIITAPLADGSVATLKGVGFSYGLARDQASAETELQRDKRERTDEGLRAGRGEPPPTLAREPAVQATEHQGEARTESAIDGRPQGSVREGEGARSVERTEPAQALTPAGRDEAGRDEGAGVQPARVRAEEARPEIARPAPKETPAPAGVSASTPKIADVPPGLLAKIMVPVEQRLEGEGVKTMQVSAREALADNQAEIDAYEKLRECVSA